MASETPMEFRILGSLEVRRDGRALSLGGAKQRAVLAILLIQADRVVSAERLTELLWGDGAPATSAHAIEVYISQLRRMLEPDGPPYRRLLTSSVGYSLHIDPAELDANVFQNLVESAKQASPEETLSALNQGLALWRGAALEDFATERFALSEIARLNELRLHAVEERIEAELALGRHNALIGELASLSGEHPLRERLCGQLMLALYRAGRQAEASDVYQRTRDRLVDEVGMEPGPQLQTLLKRILQQDPTLSLDAGWPTSSAQPPRTNLPAELSSFIGRQPELIELKARISASRLVTLTGVGGSGKTRLGLKVAADMIDQFVHGVWFMDLAPISDAGLIPQTMANALGVREHLGRPILSTVSDHLRGGPVLLLIDNCEHVVDVVAGLTEELLRGCPQLHVLATSRERLGVSSEHVYHVPPLSVPPEGTGGGASELTHFESVELFIQRAMHSRSSFEVNDANAKDVAELVRRLDGIPLAIELAAAQMPTLTPKEIVRNLGERFELLKGSRTGLPRNRTLWATLDWSYQFLDETERIAFRRLAVFAGSFDLEAAKFVVSDDAVGSAEVPAIVSKLSDKSLVVAEPEASGETRFRLLETVRQFSLHALRESGETDAIRNRHARLYSSVVDALNLRSGQATEGHRLQQFRREEGNLRAALEWLRSTHPLDGVKLAIQLAWYWEWSGAVTEGRSWLETMITAGVHEPATLAAALSGAGLMAWFQGDFDGAWVNMRRSLELKREAHDLAGVPMLLGGLAEVALARGDSVEALRLGVESLALATESADARSQAWARVHLGFVNVEMGDFRRAGALFMEARGGLDAARDFFGLGFALGGLTFTSVNSRDLPAAREWTRQLVGIITEHDLFANDPSWAWVCGVLAEAEGRDASALRLWGAGLRLASEGISAHHLYRRLCASAADRAKARLGPFEAQRLTSEGGSMPREALMAEVLGDQADIATGT